MRFSIPKWNRGTKPEAESKENHGVWVHGAMVDYNLTLCRRQMTMGNPMPESTLYPRQVTLGIGLTDSEGLLSHC